MEGRRITWHVPITVAFMLLLIALPSTGVTATIMGYVFLAAVSAAGVVAMVQLLRRMPASMKPYLDDTDAWVSNSVPASLRVLLWGQIAAAAGLAVFLALGFGPPGPQRFAGLAGIPIVAAPLLWGLEKVYTSVGVWCKEGWVPDVRLWDRMWWAVHSRPIAARRWWTPCSRRRSDAALYVASFASVPGVILGLVLAIAWLSISTTWLA